MSRVILRNVFWLTLFLCGLMLLQGCTTIPPKETQIVLPSTLPARKSVAAVKESTQKGKISAEEARDRLDKAIVAARQEAQAASDAERKTAQETLRVTLEAAKKAIDDSAAAAGAADQHAADAVREVEALRASQDKVAMEVQKTQEQNEAYRQRAISGERFWGLGYVWVGMKMFLVRAFAWIAGFAVLLGALSFFVPAIGSFVSMVLSNIFKLFTRR